MRHQTREEGTRNLVAALAGRDHGRYASGVLEPRPEDEKGRSAVTCEA